MRRWRSSTGSETNDSADDEAIHQRFVRVVGLPTGGGSSGSEHQVGCGPTWSPTRQVLGPAPLVQGSEPGRARAEWPATQADREVPEIGQLGVETVSRGAVQVDAPAVVADAPGPVGRGHIALAGFDPGRRGVRVLAAVAATVVVLAGLVAWLARPRNQPVSSLPVTVVSGAPSLSAGSSATVVVAVAGRVQRPGLLHLVAGSRVADAVEAAGGALPGVDLSTLNMARKVVDGETIFVGVAAPSGFDQPPGGQSGAVPGGRVNLNTATQEQLQTLPGVGPVLAQRILDYRGKRGPFRSVNDLRQVPGIGNARFEQLKDMVAV